MDRAASARRRVYEVLDHTTPDDALGASIHRAIVVLIVVNLVAVVLETVPSFSAGWHGAFQAIEFVSATLFTVEYALRLWIAPEHPPLASLSPWRARLAWARQPAAIVDFLSILPLLLVLVAGMDLRALIIFRLVRFFKLARYSPGMSSLLDAVTAERRALGACLVILLGCVLVAASVMHVLEAAAQPERFGTIPDAMYWAVITLTTVGYGDVTPVTPSGKLAASLTAIMGLVMLALPVAIISSAFSREIHKRDFVVNWSMVSRVPLFAGLQPEAVGRILRYLKSRMHGPDEVIVRRGDPAHSMFFIASGSVEVDLPGKRLVLEEGHFFGEMALMRRTERSATVRSIGKTRLLELDAGDLRVLMIEHPDMARNMEMVMRQRSDPSGDANSAGDLAPEEISQP